MMGKVLHPRALATSDGSVPTIPLRQGDVGNRLADAHRDRQGGMEAGNRDR